jgi:organizing structure protein 2
VQIGKVRVALYHQALKAETSVNNLLTGVFDLESSFTNTVASLAPAPESGERLMPGAVYVLVSSMAGSIMVRNRNILLRAAGPVGFGIGAAWMLLPVTMNNVSGLLWEYERKFPVVADTHLRVREGIEKAGYMARVHSRLAVDKVEETVTEAREVVEGWVRKGK